MDKNKVVLVGRLATEPVVSHTEDGEVIYKAFVESARLSGVVDRVRINVNSGWLCKQDLHKGDGVEINGELVTHNQKVANGKTKLVLKVKVDSICRIDINGCERDENIIDFTGYVCKDVVLRETPLGRRVADVLVAINGKSGASYVPCIVWNDACDIVRQFKVGAKIEALGRIQSREYQKRLPNGTYQKHTTFEVSIFTIREST